MGGSQQGTNVFDGKPDARQSDKIDHPVSRFRPTYRALTEPEKALHDEIKTKAVELEQLISYCATVPGANAGSTKARYGALAITSLEESIMWAVKAPTS